MPQNAIEVVDVSKRYRIGQRAPYTRFSELMVGLAKRPLRRLLPDTTHSNGPPAATDFWALKDVNFAIEEGEVLGIIGRNGAGKSTLLKIISRITDPTTGTIRLRGRVSSLLEVGTGFHPELTGRENVFLNGAILGMSTTEVRRKFDQIVAFAELERFLDTPVKHYSSGMYMRLAFAVAAHLEPEILIVDEVLAVGDAEFQKKCLGKINDVAGSGRTVLFVSHNIGFIQQTCSTAMLMVDGKVAMRGRPDDVIQNYVHSQQPVVHQKLDELPRSRGLGEAVRITRCRLLNSNGDPATHVCFGEPFTAEVEVHSRSNQNELALVIGIDTLSGQRLVSASSVDSQQTYQVRSGESLTMRVTFDEPLIYAGQYAITVGIRSGRIGLDQLQGCAPLEITTATHAGVAPATGLSGFARLPGRWA